MRWTLLAALALTGCATVINDQKETIPVTSEPPGAVVTVECGSAPVYGGLTPASLILERTADPCAITVAKEGYAATRVELRRETSKAMRGNKVPGVIAATVFGLVALVATLDDPDGRFIGAAVDGGMAVGEGSANAVDRKTGAAYKHVPSKIFVRLAPEETPPPPNPQ